MEVSRFPFKGRYEGEGYTLEDVISSLEGQRVLIRKAIGVIENLDRNFTANKVVIRVLTVEEGSLLWDLLVEVWGAYQQPIIDNVAGSIEKAVGVDIPAEYEPLVTLVTLAVFYWSIRYAYDRVTQRKRREKSGEAERSIHIEGNYNTVVQMVADTISGTPSHVEDTLDEALFGQRQKVTKAAVRFAQPAQARGRQISIEDAPSIPEEVIRDIPTEEELKDTSDPFALEMPHVTLSIRGTDRDHHASGWRALVEGDDRFEKRLPMVLDPHLNPDALADHSRIIGDIAVEGDEFLDGRRVFKRIRLKGFTPFNE